MTNIFSKTLALAVLVAASTSCGSSDTGGGSGSPGSTGGATSSTGGFTSTTAGNEGGPCYPNSTCNQGLTCASNLCVKLGGGTGGSGNTTGSGGTTGIGGVLGGTGGVSPRTGGTISTGGTPGGTGGTITSTGGTSPGTGGSPSCTNTQTDPNNCGTCGHVCRGTCTAGKCDPALGPCFSQADGLATCSADCASFGETCIAAACDHDLVTMVGYPDMVCSGPSAATRGSCSDAIVWTGAPSRRCCCQ